MDAGAPVRAPLSRYREVEPYDEAKRHLVEIPDRFAVARWSRDADVAEIARCILGTLKYEPHSTDVIALRRALESVIEAETGARR